MLLRRSLTTAALAAALVVPAAAADASTAPLAAAAQVTAARGETSPAGTRVLAISVDGLNTDAIRQLGDAGAPNFHRMLDEGAGTLNARTEYEQTVTLPNHTGMMTGRRVEAARGGHGVTWDDDRPGSTVAAAAGHRVSSVFSVTHRADLSTALFSTKSKFSLYQRSWPTAIDRFVTDEKQRRLVRTARRDLVKERRAFTFLHVSLPDRAGHDFGGMSPKYLDAVRSTDRLLGTLLSAIQSHAGLRNNVVVVLTADHGFAPGLTDHSGRTLLANYRIPFLVWGAGVDHAGLYAINPDYRSPGTRRPTYAAERQPVRNGDVANLALSLLGLGKVPGSELDADQSLRVAR